MVNQVQNVELHPIQKLLRSGDYEKKKQYFMCNMPGDTGKCGFTGTFSDMISHTAAHWHCHMFVCQVCSRQIHEYNEIYRHTDPANHHPCSASPREMTLNTSNRFGFVDLWKSRNVFISQISKGEYLSQKTTKKRSGGANTTATPMYDDEDGGRGAVFQEEDRFGYDDNDNYSYKQQNNVPRTIGGGARNANLEPLRRDRRQSRVRFDIDESPQKPASSNQPRAPPGINPRGTYQNQRSQSRAPNNDYCNPPRGDYQTPQNNRGRAGFGNSNGGGGGNNDNNNKPWNNRNSNGEGTSNYGNRSKSRGRGESSGDFGGGEGAIRNRSPSDDFRTPNNRQARPNYGNPPDPRMSQGSDSIYRHQNINNRSPPPSGGSRSSTSSSMFRSPTQSPIRHSESRNTSQNEPGSSSSYSNSQYNRSPQDYSRPPPPLPTRGAHRSPTNNPGARNYSNPHQSAYRRPSPSPPRNEINPPAVHRSPLPQNDEGFTVYCSPPPQETPAETAGGMMTRSQIAGALKRKAAPIRTEEPNEPSGTIDLAIKKPDEMVRQRRSSVNYRSVSRGRSMSRGRENSDEEQMREIEKTRKMYQIQGKGTVKVLQNTSRMSSLLSNPLSTTSPKSRNNSVPLNKLPPKTTTKLDRLRANIMASQGVTPEPELPHTPLSTTFPLDSVANIPLPSPGSVSKCNPTPPETPGSRRTSAYRTPSPQPVPPPSFPPGITKRPRLQLENDDDEDVEVID